MSASRRSFTARTPASSCRGSRRRTPRARGGWRGGCATHSAMTRVVAPICTFLLIGCATHRLPAELRGYAIVVEERDPQSVELARALRERGVKVRARVRGGSGRTAALFYFTYSDP